MDKNLFIGREYEIRQLEKYRNSKESEFVIVYGRRRVGKTFLIKEFFDDTYDFKVTGLYKKPKKMQLKNFYLALQEYGANIKKVPTDWLEAFAELKKLLKSIKENRKKALIYNNVISTAITIVGGYLVDGMMRKSSAKFIEKFKALNSGYKNISKCVEGLNIIRPAIIFAAIYYGVLPIFSTYLSEKIDKLVEKKHA